MPADQNLWENLGGAPARPQLAVVSRAPGTIDVLAIRSHTNPDRVWCNTLNGAAWQGWEDLGNLPKDVTVNQSHSPAAIALAPDRLDAFFVSGNGVLYRAQWTGGQWKGWKSLGAPAGGLASRPSLTRIYDLTLADGVAHGVAVVARGADTRVWGKVYWGKGSTAPWQNLGGQADLLVPATSLTRSAASLDVFAAGADLQLRLKYFNFQSGAGSHPPQSDWKLVGGGVLTSPYSLQALREGPRVDVFFTGKNDPRANQQGVLHKWGRVGYEGEWNAAPPIWGSGISRLQAVRTSPTRIDLVCRGGGSPGAHVFHRSWDGTTWTPPLDVEWESIGGDFYIQTPPALVSWGPARLDVFMVSANEQGVEANTWHRWWDGTAWSLAGG